MFRNLSALEIAEGALLADIAVAIQFLAAFFPVVSNFFALLNFTVFAILVLRRGLYVGIMGMCVAVFLLCVLIGPHSLFLMLAEGLGGLFLGFMMRHRFHHFYVLFVGVIGGAVYAYIFLLGVLWLSGTLQAFLQSIHRLYAVVVAVISPVAHLVGLGAVWQQDLLPDMNVVANWAFAYWWMALFFGLLLGFCPVVMAIYAMSNSLVRLFGYDVRPVMGGKIVRRLRWRLLKLRVRRMKRRKQWSNV
jgi:hypothetical protein